MDHGVPYFLDIFRQLFSYRKEKRKDKCEVEYHILDSLSTMRGNIKVLYSPPNTPRMSQLLAKRKKPFERDS